MSNENVELKIGSGLGASGARSETEGGTEKKTRRARSDTAVRRLTPEQRAKVDGWLFDEQLSYDAAAARCQTELGVAISPGCIGAYCRQEQGGGRRHAAGAGSGSVYLALLNSMNQAALRAARHVELSDDPRVVAQYARVLVSARQEANHALRAATTREKFEFDAATACLIHQVKVQSIASDEALDDGQRIMKIREELFGPNLPA